MADDIILGVGLEIHGEKSILQAMEYYKLMGYSVEKVKKEVIALKDKMGNLSGKFREKATFFSKDIKDAEHFQSELVRCGVNAKRLVTILDKGAHEKLIDKKYGNYLKDMEKETSAIVSGHKKEENSFRQLENFRLKERLKTSKLVMAAYDKEVDSEIKSFKLFANKESLEKAKLISSEKKKDKDYNWYREGLRRQNVSDELASIKKEENSFRQFANFQISELKKVGNAAKKQQSEMSKFFGDLQHKVGTHVFGGTTAGFLVGSAISNSVHSMISGVERLGHGMLELFMHAMHFNDEIQKSKVLITSFVIAKTGKSQSDIDYGVNYTDKKTLASDRSLLGKGREISKDMTYFIQNEALRTGQSFAKTMGLAQSVIVEAMSSDFRLNKRNALTQDLLQTKDLISNTITLSTVLQQMAIQNKKSPRDVNFFERILNKVVSGVSDKPVKLDKHGKPIGGAATNETAFISLLKATGIKVGYGEKVSITQAAKMGAGITQASKMGGAFAGMEALVKVLRDLGVSGEKLRDIMGSSFEKNLGKVKAQIDILFGAFFEPSFMKLVDGFKEFGSIVNDIIKNGLGTIGESGKSLAHEFAVLEYYILRFAESLKDENKLKAVFDIIGDGYKIVIGFISGFIGAKSGLTTLQGFKSYMDLLAKSAPVAGASFKTFLAQILDLFVSVKLLIPAMTIFLTQLNSMLSVLGNRDKSLLDSKIGNPNGLSGRDSMWPWTPKNFPNRVDVPKGDKLGLQRASFTQTQSPTNGYSVFNIANMTVSSNSPEDFAHKIKTYPKMHFPTKPHNAVGLAST